MTVMSPSFSASAFIWFIMWTKNGKFSPGTDSMIVSGLSSACAGSNSPNATLTAPAIASVLRITVIVLSSQKSSNANWAPRLCQWFDQLRAGLGQCAKVREVALTLPHGDRSRQRRLVAGSLQGADF